jgi:hypothetical protein
MNLKIKVKEEEENVEDLLRSLTTQMLRFYLKKENQLQYGGGRAKRIAFRHQCQAVGIKMVLLPESFILVDSAAGLAFGETMLEQYNLKVSFPN